MEHSQLFTHQRMAFKEWAVICRNLRSGEQSLILRKGGIHEGRAGFRVEHPQFWLFPTYLHESEQQLTPRATTLLQEELREAPQAGQILLQDYALVTRVDAVTDLDRVLRLHDLHAWSEKTVRDRFAYRQPGLFVLTVRMFHRPQPIALAESPHFAGCRSWVDLEQELETAGLTPVLGDDAHAAIADHIATSLALDTTS